MTTTPSRTLETFPNPAPQRDFTIHIEISAAMRDEHQDFVIR